MPSPGKRQFDEFRQDYATTFPLSPLSYDNGFHAVKVKQDRYEERIRCAYNVANHHPEVEPTRYMPGAYPDDIVLPEMMLPPQIVVWGAVRFYQSVGMAQNIYSTGRRVCRRTRRAIQSTQRVVISVVDLLGCAKRRVIQVFSERSNQQIIRDASRVPSSRASPPKRRQSPPRPSMSSTSTSVPSAVHREQTVPEAGPSTHPFFEATSSSTASPSSSRAKPFEFLKALLKNKGKKQAEKTPRSDKMIRTQKQRSRQQTVLTVTENAGNKFVKQTPGQWYRGRLAVEPPTPGRKGKKARKVLHYFRGTQATTPAPLSSSTNASVIPPPVLFSSSVDPSSFVADATPAAPVNELEQPSTSRAAENCACPVDELEEAFTPQAAEHPSPPAAAGATPIKPVKESQLPPVEQSSSFSPPGTYNGQADISMADASLLDEAIAPPRRSVHWHESPRSGGPVSDTRLITPRGAFSLIVGSSAVGSGMNEVEVGGMGPTVAENASVNGPASVVPMSGTQTTTSNTSPPVIVENTPILQLEQATNASPAEPSSVEVQSVQDEMSLLSISQATAGDRFAKSAATRVAKAAERKRREEEAARARKEADEAAKRKLLRRFPVNPVIAPLSAEWDGKVTAALSQRNEHLCATTPREGVKLTRRDFATALPQVSNDGIGYLNDEIINGYLESVTDYGNGTAGGEPLGRRTTPKVFAWNSHFYSSLRDNGYKSVARWSKKRNIDGKKLLDVEHVFVPINQNLHWMLLHISPKARTIEFFDSLLGTGAHHIRLIKEFLKEELGKDYVASDWQVLSSRSSEQMNGIDCGVFTVTTAKMVVLGVDPRAFTHKDTHLQRRRMLAELINGGFMGDFEPNVVFE